MTNETLTVQIKEIMCYRIGNFFKEEADNELSERTTDEYLTLISFHGTDTNKDTLWNQVAIHVIQEIFSHIKNLFVGDENYPTEKGKYQVPTAAQIRPRRSELAI